MKIKDKAGKMFNSVSYTVAIQNIINYYYHYFMYLFHFEVLNFFDDKLELKGLFSVMFAQKYFLSSCSVPVTV